MGQKALLPFRKKVCWRFFRSEKSDGFDRVWTREIGYQHSTSRPPKPHLDRSWNCVVRVALIQYYWFIQRNDQINDQFIQSNDHIKGRPVLIWQKTCKIFLSKFIQKSSSKAAYDIRFHSVFRLQLLINSQMNFYIVLLHDVSACPFFSSEALNRFKI